MSKAALTHFDELYEDGLIDSARQPWQKELEGRYAIGISRTMAERMQQGAGSAGIARQFIPQADELDVKPYEIADPTADDAHSPVKGIVHRYPDRVLLTALHACPVYCRFCFRREKVGPDGGLLSPEELDAAYAYIRRTPGIWEVILSGGDPLMLSARRLAEIRSQLDTITHVEILRLHSRVPLVTPDLITLQKIEALKGRLIPYIVLHANHPDEFTPAGIKALEMLKEAGITLLSQSVLLKGVNDDADTLAALMRTFVRHGVKPYYLHQMDPAPGTSHFHVPVERGQELMRELRGRVSGLCQPTYVVEQPEGRGKIPLTPDFTNPTDRKREGNGNAGP